MEVRAQHHIPAALPQGKGAGTNRREEKNILPLLTFEPQTVQPVSHYHTDYAILAPVNYAKFTLEQSTWPRGGGIALLFL
jgi:hypothetical protein